MITDPPLPCRALHPYYYLRTAPVFHQMPPHLTAKKILLSTSSSLAQRYRAIVLYLGLAENIGPRLALIATVSSETCPWLSWIERLTTDQEVGSSNLPGHARNPRRLLPARVFYFGAVRVELTK